MLKGKTRGARKFLTAIAVGALAGWSMTAQAQQAAPAAPPAELNALAGNWTTALEGLPGGPQLGTLVVEKAADGADSTSGKVTTPLGEMEVDGIRVSGPKHVMMFDIEAMGQPMDVQVEVKVDGDEFNGDFLVGGGMLQATIRGAKTGSDAEAALKTYVEERILEIIGVPELPIEDAKDFVGAWTFKGESPMGGDMEVEFEIIDVDGKASSKLHLPAPLGTHTINKIHKSDTGLNMTYEMEMMGSPMDITVDMERDGNMVVGLIDVGGGLFQIPLEGVAKGRGFSKLTAGGKTVIVEYGRPSTDGAGYKQISTVKEGFTWRMGSNAKSTLKTDVALMFGDTKIDAGHYALFAKKTGDSWTLIFNGDPEGHGMAHDVSKDVASVPLTAGKPAASVELLTLELKKGAEAGSGVFRLAWGDQEGTAEFKLDLPPPPAPAGGTK